MGNENEQNEARWFLIEHKDCGAIFTIDSKQFIDSYKNETEFKCPNCHAIIIKYDISYRDKPDEQISDLRAFIGFLTTYNHLTGELKGFSIREIQPEELEAIKSPHKLSK